MPTIRERLTLWYTSLVAVLLVAFSAGVVAVQSRLSRSQFDAELDNIVQTVGSVLREELDRSHDLARAAAETRKSVDIPSRTVAVLDASGRPLAAHWHGFRPAALPHFVGPIWVGSVRLGRQVWRVHVTRIVSDDGAYQLVSAGSLDEIARARRLLARALLVSTPIALLVAAAFCWWTAGQALVPLTMMASQAAAITAPSIDGRLGTAAARDEIGQLAQAFNRLLDRLCIALRTQRQFMADASHELRTPISVARTAAEVTLAAPRDEAGYREALDIVRDQTVRLGRMVDDMLVLARADAEGYRLSRRCVYVDELATECVDGLNIVASQRGICLECRADAEIPASVDDHLIRQLVTNLVDNALKHTPAGGHVVVDATVSGRTAILAVSDSGCGITGAERERVFQRFVRLNPARDNDAGAGLGLPIARWIAELHGGTLTLTDSPLGGCRFIAQLPVVLPETATARAAVEAEAIASPRRSATPRGFRPGTVRAWRG